VIDTLLAKGPAMLLRTLSCLLLLFAASTTPAGEKKRGLDITWIDTEGGAATLIVTPAGESILIDCGNPGSRDAGRIHKAAKEAGLTAIDHLVITHWHLDHYGSVGRLSKLLPIRHYWDRGIPAKLDEDRANFPVLIKAYRTASGGKSTMLKAGDEIKLKQAPGSPAVKLLCVCASGEVIAEKAGASANPFAKEHKPAPIDTSDNARSLGFVLSFGDFCFLDLGDLTWNVEHRLVSPTNRIGEVDVYQVTHHGLEISNNPVLIKSVNPRVAVCNNGPRKGGHPSVIATLRRLPDIQGIYQLHRNLGATDGENADADHIANDLRKKQTGQTIALAVAADAKSYKVTVPGKGKTRTFRTRAAGK
jgi:beta-lactamase superfamily II metal-dependent hydrolase